MSNCLGFIGGSGLYDLDFLSNKKLLNIKSNYGQPSDNIIEGQLNGNKIYFLPRHGVGHKISPSNINYRANIDSLKQCGVSDIISLSAVGSLNESLDPGTFVIVDQFIDNTKNRKNTFFDEDIIAHVPMANPTSKELMNLSKNILDSLDIKNVLGATYITIEGPQFSTFKESTLYKSWGCDLIGMTNMPEAKLCREAEIRYCSVSMVTDFDCWRSQDEQVNTELIINTMNQNSRKSLKFINNFIDKFYKGIDFSNDFTHNILDTSIITNYKNWNKNSEKKLEYIIKRFKDNLLIK